MSKSQIFFLTILRLALGIFFFYAGITKVFDPSWSAGGYLASAKTFAALYHWFASPALLPIINFINEWGLTLLGISLILGFGVRLSTPLGVALMLLYYLPVLNFPYVTLHSWIVDRHVIYAAALLVLYSFRAGRIYGIGAICGSWPLCKQFPKFHTWFD